MSNVYEVSNEKKIKLLMFGNQLISYLNKTMKNVLDMPGPKHSTVYIGSIKKERGTRLIFRANPAHSEQTLQSRQTGLS